MYVTVSSTACVQTSRILYGAVFYSAVRSTSQLRVRLGGILRSDLDQDAVYSSVSRVVRYPYYNSRRVTGDVALLQLTSSVTFTDTIRPICLPSRDVNVNRFKVCVDTGFGRTSPSGW